LLEHEHDVGDGSPRGLLEPQSWQVRPGAQGRQDRFEIDSESIVVKGGGQVKVRVTRKPAPQVDEWRHVPWQDLFDGKTFEGWQCYTGSDMKALCSIDPAEECIRFYGRGLIRTDKEYNDFELAYKWRIEGQGDGGVQYRATGPATEHCKTAPCMQANAMPARETRASSRGRRILRSVSVGTVARCS
jgi:hypothetical protein